MVSNNIERAVCTIVAKNYLSLAIALGNSIKRYNPEIRFSILLADTDDNIIDKKLPFEIYLLSDLSLTSEQINELSFKYNVTEFCTAVKPYFFEFLFKRGAEKVVYFDPDVFLFSSIDKIYRELDEKSIIVTPHVIQPQFISTNTTTDSLLLYGGVFNFGFIAVKSNDTGKSFIQWWSHKLLNQCYQDKIEAYHTDQKWGDLIPAFWSTELLISKDMGRNVAFWNIHERKIIKENGLYFVLNRLKNTEYKQPLMFFHFAGYLLNNPKDLIHKNNASYTLNDFPELKELFIFYGEELVKSGYNDFINEKYGFNFYTNGDTIKAFHRRLYRRLISDGKILGNPFETGDKSFYRLLKRNSLLSPNKAKVGTLDKLNETNFQNFDKKVHYLNSIMKILKNVIGANRYFLLLKFCQRYFRTENQSFLIKEFGRDYKFINENRTDILK